MKQIKPEEVVAAATAVAYQAMRQCDSNIKELDDRGYGNFATEFSNFRYAIETALGKLTDNLIKE